MPTKDQLASALKNAHAAGDVSAAKTLANALKSYQEPQVSKAQSAVAGIGQGATLGFGDELSGVVSGAMDTFMFPENYPGQGFMDRYRARRDQRRQENAESREANPGTYLGGEMVGGLATGGAGAGRAAAGMTLREVAKQGAKVGAVGGAGMSESEDAAGLATDTAVGAGLGAGLGVALPAAGAGLQRLGRGVADKATDAYGSLVNVLEDAGVSLTSAQKLGTDWAKALETTLAQIPIGGKPLQNSLQNTRKSYQKALLRMVGLTDGEDLINRKTLEKAREQLSREYTQALQGKKVSIADDDFLDDLAAVAEKHSDLLDSPTAARVESVIEKFLNKAAKEGGEVSGEWYQAQRSLFGQRAKGTGELSDLYRDLRNVLDDAFARTAGTGKREIDTRYARFKQLENIFNRVGGSEASEGFIPFASLARESSKGGGKDWEQLARAGAAVIPDRVPNSATAQRNYMLQALTGGGLMFDPVSTTAALGASRVLANQMAKGRAPNVMSLMRPPNIPQNALTVSPSGLTPVILE